MVQEQLKHTYNQIAGSSLSVMDWKVDAFIDLQGLITCNWPHIDPAVSAKLSHKQTSW